MANVNSEEQNILHSIPNISDAEYRSLLVHAVPCGTGFSDSVIRTQWGQRTVAIKRFEHRQSMIAPQRILNELHVLVKCLGHPNIVQLLAAGPDLPNQRCLFHVTEYADSFSLDKVLHHFHSTSYTLAHAVSWALQAAQGLDFLHHTCSPPHCHGDLKPANMLLFDGGVRLKLSDFGATGTLGLENTRRPATLVYAAPELAFIRSGMDLIYTAQCDVYSWAISFWEILARQRPYECGAHGDPPKATFWSVFNARLPSLRNCPDQVRLVCDSGKSPNPTLRPTANHIVNTLRFFLDKILLRGESLLPLVIRTEEAG